MNRLGDQVGRVTVDQQWQIDTAHPVWYHNLPADPGAVQVQDGPEPFDVTVREVGGDERAAWWERAVAVFSNYAEYQGKTDREIPVLIASPR